MTYTFEQLEKEVNEGEILSQGKEGDVLWMIIRGPFCLCAYVGIDRINPLSPNYGDIDLDVHGGLTYGEIGDGGYRSRDKFWYGWDYGHYGDRQFWSLFSNSHEWTVEEVEVEAIQAAKDMGELLIRVRALPEST